MSATSSPAHNGWGKGRSKTISWHDPVALAAAAAGLSGKEFLEAVIEGRLPQPPIAQLTGSRLVAIGDGEALFRCTPDESTYNPLGLVHGGLLCTLLDSAAGCAVHTLLLAGVGYSTIEIKVSFLKAIRADVGHLEVHGTVLRIGRRVAVAEAHARDPSGVLLGHGTASLAVLRP